MSHQERNGVRAAYIHKAEHLEERQLMLQWWTDFLDANQEKGKRKLTAVCSHQTRIGNLDAHLI
ncbi:hypothetical protein CP48_17940 [Escherichia coli]|nr:hypothetical protein CP48_17940 [Escherichia coli]EET7395858.1 hypothetical protein [Escherichia coli]EEX8875610.1 hypothetical protein [Escherichia coli]EFI7023897.1 hypothetical protein [Escherichia coli]